MGGVTGGWGGWWVEVNAGWGNCQVRGSTEI